MELFSNIVVTILFTALIGFMIFVVIVAIGKGEYEKRHAKSDKS